MNRQEFYSELKNLETRFAAQEPELAQTVRDPQTGVEGYIVVWNTKISEGGPLQYAGKGGTRITPTVSMDEVKMLARTMALKNAAAGLPLGGSKSGFKDDPDSPGFEQRYRSFVRLCAPYLHENGGIFGGFGFDIGARPILPVWACDELKSTRCFTGKPVEMGGTDYDREGIAGLGVVVAAKTLLETEGKSAKGATFAVQGLGAMGAAVLKYFSEYGGVCKAVSDPKYGGTFYFDNGMPQELVQALGNQDTEKARALLQKGGYRKSEDLKDPLYADVDVIFPCALQNVIGMDNVAKIRARYMSEGANGPCSDEARTYLHEKGVMVIPDFIANPGGIIAAFIELTSKVTPEENAKTRAKVIEAKNYTVEKISQNVHNLMKTVRELDVEPTHAGRYIALSKIVGTGKQDMKSAPNQTQRRTPAG